LAKKINSKLKAKKVLLDYFKNKENKLCSYDEILRVVYSAIQIKASVAEQQLANLVELGSVYKTPNNKYVSAKSKFLKGTIFVAKRAVSIKHEDIDYPISNDPRSLDLFFNGDEVLFLKKGSRIDLIKVYKRANKQITGTIEFMKNFSRSVFFFFQKDLLEKI